MATVVGLSYLAGSLPIVYLLGRTAGVDLRRYGSGNVGSHNLHSVAGPGIGLAGWLSDAAKGALPVLVTRRLARDEALAGMALIGALAGQCWPPLLGWRGGRGVATLVGGMLTLTPRAAPWALGAIAGIAGLRPLAQSPGLLPQPYGGAVRAGAVPIGVIVGTAIWPVVCALRGNAGSSTAVAGAAAALLSVRRITANGWPKPGRRASVLLTRLLVDRDHW
ncbi:MAG: glycerol-3-phosphate acyltransferase [Chloroflexota bacterium]